MVRRCHGDRLRSRHVPRQHGALGSFVITPPHTYGGARRGTKKANNAQHGAPARLSRAAAGARRLLQSCSQARCRRLCSCSLLNSQSVFFSIRPLLCAFLTPASRSCPPFIGLQAWTQLRIRAASGRGRVSEACGASASHRARCRKGRHRACRRQTEIWRVFIWPDRELPSRSVTLTQ